MSKVTSYPADYQTFPTLFELEPVAGKKVTVDFSAPALSSLGGLTLVREYEKSSSSIIERIESCIKDPRWEPMVIHSQTEMLRQRIYQIMAGFEDADDCDRLCGDGILKMCAGRSASDEMDLASQPTMTRLENRLSRKELFDIGEAFIDDFIASYNSEPDSIIIDADDTNADTYGAQQLTLFNAYYGEYCYMPLLLFEGRSGKLILPVLRPGRGNKAINIAGLLKRLILKLRKKWKHTQIIVRGNSHFCSHDFMDWATDRQDGIHSITGLAGNVKLKRISANWPDTAIASYEATGEEVRIFHSFMYKAGSWKHQQRVVVKIEVNNLNTKRSSGNCLCYLVSSHVYDPVDVISAGSFLHIENIRQQIMPIFVIKDQNMPIRHTEKETADKVMAALKNPSRLFKSSVINWAGTTIDTDVQYVEVISRILLNNLEILESIPCIRRSLQYRTQGHDGIFDASSNRKEEIVGMILFNQKTVSPDYGEVLDYQIPLKANGRDKVGFKAFDLLSYDKVRNTAWILELKVSDNENDSLLHSVLEAYTYLNTVHREKLLDDFSLDTSAELKAAVLSIEGDRRHREYKALDFMPLLKQLISRLGIEVFFLSEEPAY